MADKRGVYVCIFCVRTRIFSAKINTYIRWRNPVLIPTDSKHNKMTKKRFFLVVVLVVAFVAFVFFAFVLSPFGTVCFFCGRMRYWKLCAADWPTGLYNNVKVYIGMGRFRVHVRIYHHLFLSLLHILLVHNTITHQMKWDATSFSFSFFFTWRWVFLFFFFHFADDGVIQYTQPILVGLIERSTTYYIGSTAKLPCAMTFAFHLKQKKWMKKKIIYEITMHVAL